MRKTLIWISGASFVLAAAVAVIAINTPGTAIAQDGRADIAPATAERASFESDATEAVDAISGLAEDILDRLVADGVITELEADEFRADMAEAREEFDTLDWDTVEQDLRTGVTRLKRLVSLASWDDIQALIEQRLADVDFESFELPDFSGIDGLDDLDGVQLPNIDVENIDWTGFEQFFDGMKQGLLDFDFDSAVTEFRNDLDAVDWDDVIGDLREELKDVDFSQYKDLQDHDLGLDAKDREKQLERLDALRQQIQDSLKNLDF
jgi:polyhydroxyalkanoate synthesis regulator phasin